MPLGIPFSIAAAAGLLLSVFSLSSATVSNGKKRYGYDEYTTGLFTARDSSITGDHMKDDAALYVNTEKGPVVLTGCGHSGILIYNKSR